MTAPGEGSEKEKRMSDKIRHQGVVSSVESNCVTVRIVQSSACGECKVAGHCHAAESKEKMIRVETDNPSGYRVGDTVTVATDTSMGLRASLYAYLLPLLLMVATLVIVEKATRSEPLAALLAIGVLVPYYIALYLLRDRMGRKLRFEIL